MTPSILVAGVGNIFLGDDAFGVEVVRRLSARPIPEGVRVADFGIRGFDLAYAFMDGYETVIMVDAMPRGGFPGTVYVVEPDLEELESQAAGEMDTHAMTPAAVFRLVQALGGNFPKVIVVGCEPQWLGSEDEGAMGLSAPVQAAVEEATVCVEKLLERFGNECPQIAGAHGGRQ